MASQTAKPLFDSEVAPARGIVQVLEDAGIDAVFGMPGGMTGRIFDALYDYQSSIRTVLVREEARAGVMAEIYGRLTGRPGVAIGQAAFLVHASMGAIEGHMASTPMLLLTDLSDNAPYSQHAPYQSGTGDYGTWDARQAFGAFCKATFVATTPEQAVHDTQLAIKHAVSGEPGPVAVLYHSRALSGRVGPESRPALYETASFVARHAPPAEVSEVAAAARLLVEAERPAVIAGNGVRLSDACAELAELAHALGAPVASSAGGKGVFDETSDWALGVYGNFGTPLANARIGEADAVLAVGTKLAATDTAFENAALLDPTRQTLIQIEIEPRNAAWTHPVSPRLIGDARRVLGQLLEAVAGLGAPSDETVERRRRELWDARLKHGFFDAPESRSDAAPLLPQRVIRELHDGLPRDAMLFCDAGENRLFMTHYYQTRAAGHFLQPAGVGGMGYAIPGALASRVVHPERPAVAVCGDGGFAIGMNGLMTALEEDLPILVVVLNNGALGWVKHGQGERSIACDFRDFDHAAIARSIGCDGFRVERAEDLPPALEKALAGGRPAVIDVHTSLSETFQKVTSPLAVQR
ncbi:MAG: thiamine pyrophosphate-binding protein [Proteobacteria bacterium]|nr:thiamine pyrophosphate-binding protein [Pseudomonadota bacterium]